jgi:phosphoribosyl-ATP pyrophosphohydrolase
MRAVAKTVKKKSVSQQASKPPRRPPRRIKINKDPTNPGNKQDVQDAGVVALSEAPPASPDVLNRLWIIIDSRRGADPAVSHSARLLARGTPQVVQKLGEELVECLIEAMAGNRTGLVRESADVLYHLLVTWVNAGIPPMEVWTELERREEVSHMTEGADIPLKRLLSKVQVQTTKIP